MWPSVIGPLQLRRIEKITNPELNLKMASNQGNFASACENAQVGNAELWPLGWISQGLAKFHKSLQKFARACENARFLAPLVASRFEFARGCELDSLPCEMPCQHGSFAELFGNPLPNLARGFEMLQSLILNEFACSPPWICILTPSYPFV